MEMLQGRRKPLGQLRHLTALKKVPRSVGSAQRRHSHRKRQCDQILRCLPGWHSKEVVYLEVV